MTAHETQLKHSSTAQVVFDYQAFTMQKAGGISRYFANLIKALQTSPEMDPLLCLHRSSNVYTREILGLAIPPALTSPILRGQGILNRINDRQSQREARRGINAHPNSIYHPTYYDPYLLNSLGDHPLVITIHDMIYELFPDLLHDPAVVARKKLMIERADRIVAVSESTLSDLIRFYPEAREKSVVIHHGASFTSSDVAGDSGASESPVENDYILFVGNRGLYKNFATLLGAFTTIAQDYPDLHIVCVGGGGFTEEELLSFDEAGCLDRLTQVSPSDTELQGLYTHARAFVFPSMYEGFGLPVLEAMACGCPCILANASSLPEVGGDAALYFDPTSVEDGARVIRKVLGDDSLRNELIAKGYNQVKNFTWEHTAREHLLIYQELLA